MSGARNGATAWFLFADKSALPAAELGTLAGHAEPEVFLKRSDQVRVGGAAVSEFDGDFETDAIRYKVRDVHGGVATDTRAGYASTGAG